MAEVQIKKVSHKHAMIMNWMVLNPDQSLRACADHFGVSQAWLSVVIHSDVFQAEFQQKLKNISARVAESIPEKLRAVADIALDKLAEKVAESEDPDFILDAADKALHRMGYAPASARNGYGAGSQVNVQQNNVFMLDAEDLARARGIMKSQGMFQPDTQELVPLENMENPDA